MLSSFRTGDLHNDTKTMKRIFRHLGKFNGSRGSELGVGTRKMSCSASLIVTVPTVSLVKTGLMAFSISSNCSIVAWAGFFSAIVAI